MKLVKMSLAAAVLLGASAFAIDNVKVSGDAKLFYGTNDMGTASLFDKDSSYADTALRLGVTGDLLKGVSFGVTANAVSTLGLENNLVSNTWTSAHNSGVEDNTWVSEAWLATTMGKTTAKLGRMELDTPLAFSEKWSVAANTFDAAVLINQDLPDTTLVGAWVGKGNGVNHLSPVAGSGSVPATKDNTSAVGIDQYMAAGAGFSTFGSKGAYAVAAVNNSLKFLTAQAWYYNVVDVADAYWLQADWDCQLVKNVKVGVQYANVDPKGAVDSVVPNAKNSSAYAVKVAFDGVKDLKVSAAYSSTDKDGVLKIANTATNNLVSAQSKLYTETYWTYGVVGGEGVDAWNLTAEYDAKIAKLGAYYTNAQHDASNDSFDEVAVTASKSFGPLDATLAYINTDFSNTDSVNSLQAYLTLNF